MTYVVHDNHLIYLLDCYYKMLQAVIIQTGADLGDEEVPHVSSIPKPQSVTPQFQYSVGVPKNASSSIPVTAVAAT